YDARVGACEAFGGTSPVNVFLYDGCFAGKKFPALVDSLGGGNTPTGLAFAKGNGLAPDAGAADVALGAWSTTFGSYTVGVTNAPQAQSIAVQHNEVADKVSTAFRTNLEVTGGAGSSAFRTHPGFADAFQPQVNVSLGSPAGQAS